MQITFTGQETSFTKTAKGGYSTMIVSYVDERGANKSWKLISFSNPKVFDTLKNAKVNDVFNITTRKNDKDFTEWASAEIVEESKAATSNSLAERANNSVKTPVVSQYETRDERNTRQRLIVRQSCLAQAVEYRGSNQDIDAILETAEQFVAWVFEAPALFEDVPQ
jgi:hypothetical protein